MFAKADFWACLVAFALAVLPCPGQTPTFHSNVNLVNVTFSVRDAAGKLVGDLNQNEVEVLEDGVPQKLKFFARTSELPLTLGIVVDASDSQHSFYKKHHEHVQKFLQDVLGPQDRAFLICFGNHIRLVSDLTASVPQIMDAYSLYEHGDYKFPELGPAERREEGTAFFDTIVYASREKLAAADRSRRALIVFSDGEDNSSAQDELDTIEAAQGADVLVYSIRYTEVKKESARSKYGVRVMRRVSRETGGADFDAVKDRELDQTFREIGAELRTLYEAAFYTSNPTREVGFRKLLVRSTRPGLVVRAKTGYFVR